MGNLKSAPLRVIVHCVTVQHFLTVRHSRAVQHSSAGRLNQQKIAFELLAFLCLTLFACATASAQSVGFDTHFWQTIAASDIIYVGEVHDSAVDHQYELKLIRGMIDHGFRFAVGWEMFDRSQQENIESWQSRQSSIDDLIKATHFQQHWGVYSPVYRKILALTEKYRIRNIALNAPPELTHKIAAGEELSEKEKASLPREFAEPAGAFRNFLTMMGPHPGLQSSNLRRFFAAQNVWDQTMASRILEFLKKNPGTKLVVFTGRGHVSRGFGIPSYVRQKTNSKQLILLPARLFQDPGEQGSAALGSWQTSKVFHCSTKRGLGLYPR